MGNANLFDEYNQAKRYQLDPEQAMGMVRPSEGGGVQWTNYSPGPPAFTQDDKKKQGGNPGDQPSADDQMSISPDAAQLQQSQPMQGQESPQQAMAMMTPQVQSQIQWPSFSSGSSGMSAGGMAAIAGAFI